MGIVPSQRMLLIHLCYLKQCNFYNSGFRFEADELVILLLTDTATREPLYQDLFSFLFSKKLKMSCDKRKTTYDV